jgi:deoxyribonuclease V
MRIRPPHSWDLTPGEAVRLQRKLAPKIIARGGPGRIRTVAGADVSADRGSRTGFAGIVVMRFPEMDIVESVGARVKLRFPYVPGLLAFREAPVLIEALSRMKSDPDVFLFDGQGLAHPRRFGIACHMGWLLNRPAIGCAKSRLCGTYREPGRKKGCSSPLLDAQGRAIGRVLRTRDDTRPIFVSVGHRIGLDPAVAIALACCGRFRVPEPTRQADLLVGRLRRSGR